MKNKILMSLTSLSLMVSALTLPSCAYGPNAQTGAIAGTFGGGALGAIIGNQSRHALGGAAIGAVAGGLAGNWIGGAYDR